MKAIILAAGRGSRMKHATDNIPKCLLKVKGKTLLEIQIEALKKSGIKKIGIVTGYLSEQLIDYCDNTFYNDKWNETNIVSNNEEIVNVQIIGTSSELDQLILDTAHSNPIEIVRSGPLGISSDKNTLSIDN